MDTIVHRTKKKGLADIHHIRIAKNLGALVTSFVVTFGLQIWIARSKRYLAKRDEDTNDSG